MKSLLDLMDKIVGELRVRRNIFFTPCKLIFYLNATVLFDYLMRFSGKTQPREFTVCLRLSLDSEK